MSGIDKLRLTLAIVKNKAKKVGVLVVGPYVNFASPLKCECIRCHLKWSPSLSNLSRGHSCPRCGIQKQHNRLKLSIAEVKKRLRKVNPDIEIIGEYKNSKSPIDCQCRRCGHLWSPTWISLQIAGCPRCAKQGSLLKLNFLKEKLKKTNPSVRIVGEYFGCQKPLKCECVKCKTKWVTTWDNLKRLNRCPWCSPKFTSEGEVRKIFERLTGFKWLRANSSELPWLHGLHLDGYCRELSSSFFPNGTAFENNGEQHNSLVHFGGRQRHPDTKDKLRQRKRRDWRKRYQCWYHGVRLINIPHWVINKENYIKLRLDNAKLI